MPGSFHAAPPLGDDKLLELEDTAARSGTFRLEGTAADGVSSRNCCNACNVAFQAAIAYNNPIGFP